MGDYQRYNKLAGVEWAVLGDLDFSSPFEQLDKNINYDLQASGLIIYTTYIDDEWYFQRFPLHVTNLTEMIRPFSWLICCHVSSLRCVL